MNEYTKRFAEKAGFVMWDENDINPRNYAVDWSSIYENELEQFAKLIVKDVATDCIDIVFDCALSGMPPGEIIKKIRVKYGTL